MGSSPWTNSIRLFIRSSSVLSLRSILCLARHRQKGCNSNSINLFMPPQYSSAMARRAEKDILVRGEVEVLPGYYCASKKVGDGCTQIVM
jgi:hypothetical protein